MDDEDEEKSDRDMCAELRRIIRDADTLVSLDEYDGKVECDSDNETTHGLFHGSIDERKCQFVDYIQDQIQKVKIRSNIISFKYSGYKWWFDFFNISILFLSALLTFTEAMRVRFDVSVDDMDSIESVSMGIFPIAVSSVVTVASALVKFKKYHTKMENHQRAIQKAIFTIFRLKRIQENAKHTRTDDELEEVIRTYSGEPYDMYIQCQEEMEKNLQYEDLVKHMRTYYDLSLSHERNEKEYRLSRLLLDATQQIREGAIGKRAVETQRIEQEGCCRNSSVFCVTAPTPPRDDIP